MQLIPQKNNFLTQVSDISDVLPANSSDTDCKNTMPLFGVVNSFINPTVKVEKVLKVLARPLIFLTTGSWALEAEHPKCKHFGTKIVKKFCQLALNITKTKYRFV